MTLLLAWGPAAGSWLAACLPRAARSAVVRPPCSRSAARRQAPLRQGQGGAHPSVARPSTASTAHAPANAPACLAAGCGDVPLVGGGAGGGRAEADGRQVDRRAVAGGCLQTCRGHSAPCPWRMRRPTRPSQCAVLGGLPAHLPTPSSPGTRGRSSSPPCTTSAGSGHRSSRAASSWMWSTEGLRDRQPARLAGSSSLPAACLGASRGRGPMAGADACGAQPAAWGTPEGMRAAGAPHPAAPCRRSGGNCAVDVARRSCALSAERSAALLATLVLLARSTLLLLSLLRSGSTLW